MELDTVDGLVMVSAVVFSALDPRGPWYPVLPADVPEWVAEPAVMSKLLSGDMARRDVLWYRAQRADRVNNHEGPEERHA